jgi:hypothetical protein
MYFSMVIPLVLLIWNSFFSKTQLAIDPPVTPRSYFVSLLGNDLNEGTRLAPFKTIQHLNSISLVPGDSVLFESGQKFTGSLRLDQAYAGDSLHPVTICSSGSGYAIILSGNESAISIDHAAWMIVKKLKLMGSGRKDGNTKQGISILNSRQVFIDSLEISGYQKSGLEIDLSNDISVSHVFSSQNGFAGISVGENSHSKKSNRHISIVYCRAENNPGDPSNLTNHSGNGIVVSNCTDVSIDYCTATENGWDMPRKGNGPVGIWAYEADSVIIQHCLSYRNKTSVGGADGGGFDLDGGVTHSIIQYCLSYENQGAGYCIFQYLYASPWHDNVIRFNISENDGTVSDAHAGLYIWNSSRDSNQFHNSFIYNNTIYNSKVAAISFSELSERRCFTFYNNILIGRDSVIVGDIGNDVFGGNDKVSMNIEKKSAPVFRKSVATHVVSAVELKDFIKYSVSLQSPLRRDGLNLQILFGIKTGGSDFNGNKPPDNGIGASFRTKR